MKPNEHLSNKAERARREFFPLAVVSLLALGAAFAAAAIDAGLALKSVIFALVAGAYLLFCFFRYFREPEPLAVPAAEPADETPSPKKNVPPAAVSAETREKLLALEEASLIFGSALKPSDMFRLIANRVAEIIPFQTMTLFAFENGRLRATQSFGAHAADFTDNAVETARGIARRTIENGEPIFDGQLNLDRLYLPALALENLKSAVAVPLRREVEIYGALVLYGGRGHSFERETVDLLEAVAERVSPLFLSSIAYEANLNSALTDPVTHLPNERALYLVLENQIAEAQRNREGRALTVLSIDIKDFDRINKTLGHETGDLVLKFAAAKIKAQLRRMDFLSRAGGDEFLAVLPTASGEIAEAIVARIEKTFAAEAFRDGEKPLPVELNFGAASFISDAETAAELLKAARQNKNDAKSPLKGSILQFPERFPN